MPRLLERLWDSRFRQGIENWRGVDPLAEKDDA